jgi:hypothetical protein
MLQKTMTSLKKEKVYSVAKGHLDWLHVCSGCGEIHKVPPVPALRISACSKNGYPYLAVYAGPADETLLIRVFGKQFKDVIRKDIAEHSVLMEKLGRAFGRAKAARNSKNALVLGACLDLTKAWWEIHENWQKDQR